MLDRDEQFELVRGVLSPATLRAVFGAEWDESKHPRDERGRFAPGGGEEVDRVGSERPSGKYPSVNWSARDLQDSGKRVTAETVAKDYGAKPGAQVYESWMDMGDLPAERLAEEADNEQPDFSDWNARDTFPPIKLRVTDAGIEIVDGNHRLRFWQEVGFTHAPAWVIDERKNVCATFAYNPDQPRDPAGTPTGGQWSGGGGDGSSLTGKELEAKLSAELAATAQKVYDQWDENPDEYAGGGICHLIADEMATTLSEHGIETSTVDAQSGEQHTWVVAQLKDGVYVIDIPPSVYERGGGYSWKKIPGVQITKDHIVVDRIDPDPSKFKEYTEQFVRFGYNPDRSSRDAAWLVAVRELVPPESLREEFVTEWDESKHPRGERGRWVDAGGDGGSAVATGTTLYHVTATESVPGIKARGLLPMQTSNWVKAGDRTRYGGGEVYAFEHKDDAIRWAAKMDWDFNHEMGSGKVSVIEFKAGGKDQWAVDTADPLGQATAQGRWLKQPGMVDPARVVGAEPLTAAMVRDLVARDRAKTSGG